MKQWVKVALACMVIVMFWAAFVQAEVISFNLPDTYIGGPIINGAQGQDQIGPEFQLASFSGNFNTGTQMATVTANGSFFTNYLNHGGLAPDYAPGNLFLGSVCPPCDTNCTKFDAAQWKYVVKDGGIYQLNPLSVVFSSAPPGYEYRADQGWTAGGTRIGDATATIVNGAMTWTFSYAGLDLGEKTAFFFTMKCGNDAEWACTPSAPVPLPPSVLLLGSGFLGMGLLGWRRKPKNTLADPPAESALDLTSS